MKRAIVSVIMAVALFVTGVTVSSFHNSSVAYAYDGECGL